MDPRLAAYLATAMERTHPFYAAQLLRFATRAGDNDAVDAALALGALSWRPEALIKIRTELTFGSLFAGIGGFDLGFHRAGLRCAWQVEIDPSCRSVLARYWPDVPRFEDVRGCGADTLTPVDVICGGFPCQDLSVAGNRAGLAGKRSGLFYEMTRITDELQPALLIWENVPGLLSSDGGRDFGRVLMELERIGYSGCWSTLDAQFFGLAQRRQRVFGVFARADIGAARCTEILSLISRLPWNTETGRAARQGVAATIRAGSSSNGVNRPGRRGDDDMNIVVGSTGERVANALACHHGRNSGEDTFVTATLGASFGRNRGLGQENELDTLVCGALSAAHGGPDDNAGQAGHLITVRNVAPALTRDYGKQVDGSDTSLGPNVVIAFTERTRAEGRTFEAQEDIAYALTSPGSGGRTHSRQIAGGFGVRRLTPLECERLQGFPDDWTAGQSDSARYRQLGNAIAVPVATWIGQQVEALL